MRLSQIFVVIAATFLLASATPTVSNQAKIVQATLPEGLSQRLLRTYPTTYEDDDSEERAGGLSAFEKLKFGRMKDNGNTQQDYATKLGIAEALRLGATDRAVMNQLMASEKYLKWVKYFNYLQSTKNK
ncbi:hypothetical protein KRP22_014264 [Phytophthora ramorum]|uniref:RXLR-class effector Avh17 n=1 Tax=Phytophthora ramorum TaxID=164328 RepID=U5Y5V9_PHYRM|nr:RXLR-class effector Avh17 [Phytophthora ramorum]KAH7501678.1 RxLR effector protein [Phytophthora ramorum]